MADGERGDLHDLVLRARACGTHDDDACAAVIATRGYHGVVKQEGACPIDPVLKVGAAVAVGSEADGRTRRASGASVREHEASLRDDGAAIVSVIVVEHEHPAVVLAERLQAGGLISDDAIHGENTRASLEAVVIANGEVEGVG